MYWGVEIGPFYTGQNAFARGEGRHACPFRDPAAQEQWLAGWMEARRYAEIDRMIETACAALVEMRQQADMYAGVL